MADIDPGRAVQFPQAILVASDAPALPRRAQDWRPVLARIGKFVAEKLSIT